MDFGENKIVPKSTIFGTDESTFDEKSLLASLAKCTNQDEVCCKNNVDEIVDNKSPTKNCEDTLDPMYDPDYHCVPLQVINFYFIIIITLLKL